MLDTTQLDTVTAEPSLSSLAEHEALEQKLRNDALDKVKQMVGEAAFADYLEYIEECSYTFAFSIVGKPTGDMVDTKEYVFNHVYVDQYRNGGYTGDDFAGSVCIPLPDSLFLSFHYAM